jgi:hypothetical protein
VWQNHTQGLVTEVRLDLFAKGPDGRYTRAREQFFERAFPVQKILGALAKTGFRLYALRDGDTFGPPRKNSQRLVFAAQKPAGRQGGKNPRMPFE